MHPRYRKRTSASVRTDPGVLGVLAKFETKDAPQIATAKPTA